MNIIMQKVRKKTEIPNHSAKLKEPLAEGRTGTRIANAREIVIVHCMNIHIHMQDENRYGSEALMLGTHTAYGQWWYGGRDPAKRPFYSFGPKKVAEAIERLDSVEATDLADQLLYISRKSVTEYGVAAEAARTKLAQIGLPQE